MLEGLFWIEETYIGYCITFARGLDEAEMLSRIVGDPSLAWLLPIVSDLSRTWMIPDSVKDEAQTLRELLEEELKVDKPIVQVGSCKGWAFALEDERSHVGTRPEVLRRVSSGTVALTLYFNPKGFTWFYYAEDGVFAAQGEIGIEPYDGDDPSLVLPFIQQARIRVQGEDLNVSFALAEVIGIRLDRESVAEKSLLRTWITPPNEAYEA